MRNARGHLANRRQALLQTGIALEPLDVREVLKCDQVARASSRSHEMRGAEADVDLPAVSAAKTEFLPARRSGAQAVVQGLGQRGRKLEDVRHWSTGGRVQRQTTDHFRGVV